MLLGFVREELLLTVVSASSLASFEEASVLI